VGTSSGSQEKKKAEKGIAKGDRRKKAPVRTATRPGSSPEKGLTTKREWFS